MQVAAWPALVCRPLEAFAAHLITTRPWTLGSAAPPEAARGWAELADAIGAPVGRVAQVHGTGVYVHRPGEGNAGPGQADRQADIILAADPAAAVAVVAADCVPLLFADTRTGAVGAAHAGWRGLAAAVPRTAVEALARHLGSRPADLLVAVGPSIGPCCYEVGPDVRERFAAAWPGLHDRWFSVQPQPTATNRSMERLPAPRPGHGYFDAARAAADQLERAGVPPPQIFTADLCTASHPSVFCSYRRDGRAAGRMAAAIRPGSPAREAARP